MKSINFIQFNIKIPSKKLNSTKTNKKKPRQPMLFLKWLKNSIERELKNNKMLEYGKKGKKKTK
jgi:hypothetical protein